MNRKMITLIIGTAMLALSIAACTSGPPSGNTQEYRQQQANTNSLESSQPLPHYNYSQIRQTLIDAETISANGTQTTSFFFQMGLQDPVFTCPSLGMPVPNSASLSNPQQPYNGPVTTDGGDVVSQMDPNGIYAPTSSSGTYVICVNNAGQPYLQYWEGDVMTVAALAEWDKTTHQVRVTGAPTAAIRTHK